MTCQVYNESIQDLLAEPSVNKNDKHDIRVDKKGRVYVEGLVECEVLLILSVCSYLHLAVMVCWGIDLSLQFAF